MANGEIRQISKSLNVIRGKWPISAVGKYRKNDEWRDETYIVVNSEMISNLS